MNIGIFYQNIINNNKDILLLLKNKNPDKIIEYKKKGYNYEDVIFLNDVNNMTLDNYDRKSIPIGPLDYYNTGTLRVIEYYENISLYKIKANTCITKCELKN
jgi:hypothetical protein